MLPGLGTTQFRAALESSDVVWNATGDKVMKDLQVTKSVKTLQGDKVTANDTMDQNRKKALTHSSQTAVIAVCQTKYDTMVQKIHQSLLHKVKCTRC